MSTSAPKRRPRPPTDAGRVFAALLCAAFAIIGAVPLGLGLLVRTEPVRAWAARETARLLSQKLGVAAHYRVVVQAWPMVVALEDVVVDASDGGEPVLTVDRVAIRPRAFSLLAGRLDAGDVEVVGPRARVVVEDGVLKNLAYRLPDSSGSRGGGGIGSPVASLSITDARIAGSIEGVKIAVSDLDLDVSAEEEGAFEVALRAGESAVTRVHPIPGRPDEDAVDDDRICHVEARARIQGRSVLVRRLALDGSADFDPDPGTRPPCKLAKDDWRAVELRLGALHLDFPDAGGARVNGRVHARLPPALIHRVKPLAHLTGSIIADLDVDYDGAALLPHVEGHVATEMVGIDGKVFGKRVDLDVAVDRETVRVTKLVAQWADGKVSIPEVSIEPFAKGIPLTASAITIEGVELPGLLRDLGAHPQAHVAWTLDKGRFEYLRGHLDPPMLEGPLTIQTKGFEIFDRPAIDPARVRMSGVREGTVRGTFAVNGSPDSIYGRHLGVVISHAAIDTPRSHLDATVTLGFDAFIDIDVRGPSVIDLGEMSPLGTIPIAGKLALTATGHGPFEHPRITGELKLTDFDFATLPVGEIEAPRFAFEPLVLELFDAKMRHGASLARAPHVSLAFDKGATVVADADVDTREEPSLRAKDLFEVFHLDRDPRLAEVDATVSGLARVHYALGGAEDRCGAGFLRVQAGLDLTQVALLGEAFDTGNVDLDLLWDDQAAGAAGMRVDLRSATLAKGSGTVLVGGSLRHGGLVAATAVVSSLPLSRIDGFGPIGRMFDGTVQAVVDVGGSFADPEVAVDASVSRLRIGPASLGPSRVRVAMNAAPGRARPESRQCGNHAFAAPRDPGEVERDASEGDILVTGALFDGQLALDDLRISRQRHRVLRGRVVAKKLDLGTLANLAPGVAFGGAAPSGKLSATLDVASLPFANPERARASLAIDELSLARQGFSGELLGRAEGVELADNELQTGDLRVRLRSASGLSAVVAFGGSVHHAVTAPDLDLAVRLEPTDLGRLSADIPDVEHAAGKLTAKLAVTGPLSAVRYAGSAELRKGELSLKGTPIALTDVDVDLDVADGDARLRRASAKLGGGTLLATGRMPLRGPEAGAFTANVTARAVKLNVAEGVNLTADAELEATYRPAVGSNVKTLPDVKGTVELTQFSYTRPIALNLSLAQLGRAPRTNVDTYDPANDLVRFSVNLVSPRPLRFSNNLVDMDLEVVAPGLVLSGTNQRYGARGLLRVLPDSKLELRSNEFLVREGFVRFDNPLKIAPKVELRAQTEYRRYASTSGPEQPAAAASSSDAATGPGSSPISAAASTSTAGVWRITLQARGEAEDLQVALTSDPPLSQEDIVLLLTLGMTRAEIDRGATAALGETVGLEALSALTGADKAVKNIVPLLDEFRFGTGYSSRTGTAEPTVTVGKRITDNVRASVTTGLSEDREVRSNLEWRLNKRLSVQASYDNLNDVSSSPVGNVGLDFRFRLEFE